MTETNRKYLFFLSFLEGGSVMACELIGAKMLAPFFGTSLYVWAAALALTLGGLMCGYFLGGILSHRYVDNQKLLYWIMIAAGLLLISMPFSSNWIMNNTISFSLQTGAVLSLLVFMFPPLVFMGMVSPVIINLLTREAKAAGNSAGNVYAISTLGGILLTFLMGFLIIPTYGLVMPAVITGVILSFFPVLSLVRLKDRKSILSILAIGMLAFAGSSYKQVTPDNYKVLYQSEGILGQIKVVDHPAYEFTDDNRLGRGLIVNNTLQTFVGLEHDLQYSIWSWAHYFPTAASIFPKGSKVLLLGLGGGTIVKQLNRLGYEVDVVEIDKRVRDVSIDFFNLDPTTNVIIDDARHYVRTSQKKYDIIIFDTFLSEAVPEHLLTIEGFEDTKKILREDGMIMINFYGFIKGKKGMAARAVYKTLRESGFITEILATPGEEASRNIIFLASLKEHDFSKADYAEPNFNKINNLYNYFLNPDFIDIAGAPTLSDNKPQLSKLYMRAAIEWKKSYKAYYRRHFFK